MYIKDPWFVILYHSSQKRLCEAGKVSHVVIRRKFINNFPPGNLRLDPILVELPNPHEILLEIWRSVKLGTTKLGALPLRYLCRYIYRYICRPLKHLLRKSNLDFPCLDVQWYLHLHYWINFGESEKAKSPNLEAFLPYGNTPWHLYRHVSPHGVHEQDSAAWHMLIHWRLGGWMYSYLVKETFGVLRPC